jgi:hypothetical protein
LELLSNLAFKLRRYIKARAERILEMQEAKETTQ